jgi:uncharacterized membrane protein (DUF2068 family)
MSVPQINGRRYLRCSIITRKEIRAMRASGVRFVALVEALKGALVLAAGLGLFALVHRHAQSAAEDLVAHFHLNPASRTPRIFIDAARSTTDARLWLLAGAAAGYATLRFVEAYGLWRKRRWAEWFAALSGAAYLPIELYELWLGASWAKITLLAVNAAVVAYMSWLLLRTGRAPPVHYNSKQNATDTPRRPG